MESGRLHEPLEVLLPLPHLVAFLAALLVCALLHVLLEHLLPFLRCQEQVPRVKHDLV